MARFIEHQKALELRKQGKSYSEIKKILDISKSTLSD
jgi:DNA-binding CsgD family transcriptional regulator